MGAVSPPGGDFSDPVTAQTLNIVQVSSSVCGGGGSGVFCVWGGVEWYVGGEWGGMWEGSGVVCGRGVGWYVGGEGSGMWEGSGVVCVGGYGGVVHMCGRGCFMMLSMVEPRSNTN